ncbi:MAG: DUF4982 domain-containing protein, partial [Verrucomicrobiales bacterium]|nr:DUF4982 domain-containing protein [Verrucomicrobiales bacterium]
RPKPEQLADYDRHCAALDIAGYNYNIGSHAEDHARVPGRVMVSTESGRQWTAVIWNKEFGAFPYIVGDFIWTAIDYLGEAGIGRVVLDGDAGGHGGDNHWPWHGAECSDIDIVGTRRPHSYFTNISWDRGEKMHLTVRQPVHEGHKLGIGGWALHPESDSWTWPGFEGEKIKAVIYARADKVKLFQDDKLIGEKPADRDQNYTAEFDLTYEPGVLRAEAWKAGQKIAGQTIATVSEPAALTMTADRQELNADGQALCFLTVEVTDKTGAWHPNADTELTFTVSGPGVIQGTANADMRDLVSYQSTKRKAYLGRALAVIRATNQPGVIKLTVSAGGFKPVTVSVTAKPVKLEQILP